MVATGELLKFVNEVGLPSHTVFTEKFVPGTGLMVITFTAVALQVNGTSGLLNSVNETLYWPGAVNMCCVELEVEVLAPLSKNQ